MTKKVVGLDLGGSTIKIAVVDESKTVLTSSVVQIPSEVSRGPCHALMVCNAGRMIAAMAMITGSVEPRRRGSFMSANSSVQHIASGLGASLGGLIITQTPGEKVEHFGIVGWIAACSTQRKRLLLGKKTTESEQPVTLVSLLKLSGGVELTAELTGSRRGDGNCGAPPAWR